MFYDFSEKKGVIFHRKCKKKSGDDRECITTEYEILNDWDFYRHGKFIVIPEKYCF